MPNLKTFLGIFLVLAVSRFIPHPPNFTSLIALSFYVPVFFGMVSIPIVVLSFVITDIFFGFHAYTLFTWGSVIVIGFCSRYFVTSILKRLTGALSGACIFFLITNFGVWVTGYYGHTVDGLLNSYIFAMPFFGYSLISTLFFSTIIETFYKFLKIRFKKL